MHKPHGITRDYIGIIICHFWLWNVDRDLPRQCVRRITILNGCDCDNIGAWGQWGFDHDVALIIRVDPESARVFRRAEIDDVSIARKTHIEANCDRTIGRTGRDGDRPGEGGGSVNRDDIERLDGFRRISG